MVYQKLMYGLTGRIDEVNKMNLKEAIELYAVYEVNKKIKNVQKEFKTPDIKTGMEAHILLKKNNITFNNMKVYKNNIHIANIILIYGNLILKSGYRIIKKYSIEYIT